MRNRVVSPEEWLKARLDLLAATQRETAGACAGSGNATALGSFREVVPVHRLAYSFGWDGSEAVPPGSSLIEIDLIEQPDGTLLRMTHSGLPNAEQCTGHAEGWAHYLGRLAEVGAGRDPGPDPQRGRTGGG